MTAVKSNRSHFIFLITSVIGGILFGVLFPEAASATAVAGDVFLNALKMTVLPLIFVSVFCGITGLKSAASAGRLGSRAILYYTLTTGLAVLVGLLVVNIIQPGYGGSDLQITVSNKLQAAEAVSVKDILLGMIHPNPVAAAAEFKILPLIFFSVLMGLAAVSIGEKAAPIIGVFQSLNEVIMALVEMIMKIAPIGIFGLIAGRIGDEGGFEGLKIMISGLSSYCFSVLTALFIHGAVILPLIYILFKRKNPFVYFKHISEALLTAFATASSSATLPVTIECVTRKAGVSRKTADVVLPVGATINMDGTALYEAVAALFIAASFGVHLDPGQQVVVALTATLASVGAAGIPEAGLVTMVLVLESVGLPAEGVGLILAVDWLLDRFRTSINVWGDTIGAAILDEKEEIND